MQVERFCHFRTQETLVTGAGICNLFASDLVCEDLCERMQLIYSQPAGSQSEANTGGHGGPLVYLQPAGAPPFYREDSRLTRSSSHTELRGATEQTSSRQMLKPPFLKSLQFDSLIETNGEMTNRKAAPAFVLPVTFVLMIMSGMGGSGEQSQPRHSDKISKRKVLRLYFHALFQCKLKKDKIST